MVRFVTYFGHDDRNRYEEFNKTIMRSVGSLDVKLLLGHIMLRKIEWGQ